MSNPRHKQILRLATITDAILESALLQLKIAAAARHSLEGQLAELDASRRAVIPDVESATSRAGSDLMWLKWSDLRRAELNKALARARVAEDEARRAAGRAFGRQQALAGVARKAAAR